ncbi:uncharacterized protein LOC113063937 isoform X1 [Carassius auratus]|uniref:non-specific serine/threonine protein kinase n=1 Tax=Carassius auratus TaxID=7957 RepID=A0A6P6M257_CARAU|nr:uncharacterized protein LOC113063937 isoform X1 [Carassius auratus]
MTAERVDMAVPDNLLILDTDAVNSSFASPPIEQNEPACSTDNQTDDRCGSVPEQHPNPVSGSSGLMQVSHQDGTIEIHSSNNKREYERSLDHTVVIKIKRNHPNDDKSGNCDFSTAAVMETDNITNSINIPKLIYLIDSDQNDKHSDSNTKDDPNDNLMSPEVILLTEDNRQEEMSQDPILNPYVSSESTGLEVSQMTNDDDPLVNTVSDVMNSEQSSCLIASNETDATFSESIIQTSSEGVDVTVEAATVYKTHPEMHDITDDFTCCGFTTSHIPKTDDPKTGIHLSLADLHEADTVNILTHASALLDTLGLDNVALETADVPVNDSGIIQTVNQDLASSNVEFCSGDLTQMVQNLLQDSKYDVTKSESSRTDDSRHDRMTDTTFPLDIGWVETCSNDPSEKIESFFPQSMHETSQIGEKHEKDLSQAIPCPTTVTDRDLDSEEIDGASLKLTRTERDVEARSDLWLDARQFLAGEEDEGAIFDKWGRSCSPSPPMAHPGNTKASDNSRRENISIDCHTEDWELRIPPVERRSSSDSWASALSDWFQAVNTYSEDSFTSVNTSRTGFKLSMAIQDNFLEQRTSPDNANNTGLDLLESEEPGQALSRGLVESDNTNGTLFKQGDKDGLPSHSDSDRKDNTTMENNMSLLERSGSHNTDTNAVVDMLNASKSPENEVSAKHYGSQQIPGKFWSAKSEGNVLVDVTGDKDSYLGLVFEEERQSSFTSQRISAYISDKNLTDCVSGEEQHHGSDAALHTCPSQSNSHMSSEVGFAGGNESLGHFNTKDCTVKPREEEINTRPHFIMPFAPLGTGNTFLHHSLLKSPQADLDLPPKGIINEIHLKSDQKPISSDDSSEDRFHTCPGKSLSSSCGDSDDPYIKDTRRKPECSDTCDINKELSKFILLTGQRFMVAVDKSVAYVTLDLEEPISSQFSLSCCEERPKTNNMPHKTSKTPSDGKTRLKHKEKPAEKQQHRIQTSKKQDLQPPSQAKDQFSSEGDGCEDRPVTAIETIVITEKIVPKTQGKKKKKHAQHGMTKPENEQPTDVESRSVQKTVSDKTENLDVKVTTNGLDKLASHPPTNLDITNKDSIQRVMSVRPKVQSSGSFAAKMDPVGINATQKATSIKLKVDASNTAMMENKTCSSDSLSTRLSSMLNEDIKRRRITDKLSGAVPIRTRPQLPAIFRQARKDGEDTTMRAYSEVVKQKTPSPKEVVVPRVVSEIQADPVPDDPQNILLWCQFSPVPPDATIKWTKEGTVLSEINKVEKKDDSRFTLTILKACSKDLGLYKCSLNAANISVSTSEYHLTSEVLMELVIPSHDQPAEPRIVDGDEENIQCSPLLFKEDFLSDQYFGDNQPASIVTEKVHFGEGMHRKAFRTTLREGNLPSFNPGHPCVLKVHNAIGYGTKIMRNSSRRTTAWLWRNVMCRIPPGNILKRTTVWPSLQNHLESCQKSSRFIWCTGRLTTSLMLRWRRSCWEIL